MKQYIINVPHLQSVSKRLSSFALVILCWAMWGYLLYPIITVINWIRGDFSVINEMRWFGGYKSLLELLQIYGCTLIVLGALWIVWILLRKLRSKKFLPAAQNTVTDDEISAFYHVETPIIQAFRNEKTVTVFFDEHGRITDLKSPSC